MRCESEAGFCMLLSAKVPSFAEQVVGCVSKGEVLCWCQLCAAA